VVHSIPSAGFVADVRVREGQNVADGDILLTVRRRDDVLELYQPVPLPARVSDASQGSVSIPQRKCRRARQQW
jgi:multidrug resistance efflux pump